MQLQKNLFSMLLMGVVSLGFASGCAGEVGEPGPAGVRGDKGDIGDPGAPGDKGDMGDPGTSASARDAVDVIPLFGENFFPEGVASHPDRTLYVGSLATGAIVRIPPGETKPEPFIAPGPLGMVGILVDSMNNTLWGCAVDLNFMAPSVIKAYDATSGAQMMEITHPGAFPNDITLDGNGNLYITDSFLGTIYRLPAGGNTIEVWTTDPLFQVPMGEFGLNGIAWDTDAIYVAKSFGGELFRIPIEAGGTAGPVAPIMLDQPVAGPDGLKVISPNVLLVVDNYGGAVHQVTVNGQNGSVLTLANKLDVPTTADLDGGDAWVAEGQFDHLFGGDPNPPDLPFKLRRVYLP